MALVRPLDPFCADVDGVPTVFGPMDILDSDHDVVRANPHLFETLTIKTAKARTATDKAPEAV